MAPALVALMPSNRRSFSSSRRSSTPQVKAPCAPPPWSARLMVFLVAALARPDDLVEDSGLAAWPPVVTSSMAFPRDRFGLMRRPAAIDRKRGASHRCGGVGAQERGERAHLLDRGEALVRLLRQEHVVDDLLARHVVGLGLAVELRLDERRPHIAGADGVAGDAEL